MKRYYRTFSKVVCILLPSCGATWLPVHMKIIPLFPLPQFNVTLLIQLACYNLSLVGGHLEEDSPLKA